MPGGAISQAAGGVVPDASEPLAGFVVIDKPAGCTSHDVVARVRRVLNQKRVGHLGTLDPIATGVLVIALGRATRLAEYMSAHTKSYDATLRLGIATDTYDTTGTSLSESDPSGVTAEQISSVLESFVGDMAQTPPMFSAVKIDGQPLYKLARAGKQIEREPRSVTVHSLELTGFEPGPDATAKLRMTVSAGFYVRSLCDSVGRRLGVGGCMQSLVRIASGPFKLEQSLPLNDLAPETAKQQLLPLTVAVLSMPEVKLTDEQAERFASGAAITCEIAAAEELVGVFVSDGRLIGVGKAGEQRTLRPVKVIA